MIDFSFIGKDGLIIQYEDIISLTGFNVARYLRSKKINDEIGRMPIQDILLSYINREDEDISKWIMNLFGISFDINDYLESINTFQPNLLYSYKVFDSAYKNGIKNLIIHSNIHSNVIEKFITTFQVPIKYTYGDIIPVLKSNINSTYITASPINIRKCLDVHTPIALTIVDDFMYTAPILIDKVEEQLRAQNVYVCFTGVLSAGLIKEE